MVPEETDDPVVASVFDRLRRRWGGVLRFYRVLAWSPELVRSWSAFAWSLRFDLAASRKLRELLVVRIASLLKATYEYEHHLQMAVCEGVTEEQVSALSDWKSSALFDHAEKAVLALADDLALTPGATLETMAALRGQFSERDCVELLVTGAFYCGVARIVNSAQVELESDHEQLRPFNNGT
ncbi:MAG: carboxymuconolactone decarboxylase family protein [Marinicaulis sp.]|nr:carboxymuconolactone decarboxylase family protein [Marinicaulis sp.]